MRFVGLGFYPRDDAMEGSKSTLILSLHDYVEQLMLKQNIHSAYYIYMVWGKWRMLSTLCWGVVDC